MKSIISQSERFGELRLIALGAIAMLLVSNLGWAAFHLRKVAEVSEAKVYVISPEGSFQAKLQPMGRTSIFEARNHVSAFMQLMFSHDELSYGEHIEAALHLIEKSEGAAIFADFQKGQVHDNYIKFGSRSEIQLDSISLDMQAEPFEGAVYGRQYVIYQEERRPLPIGASFSLIKVPRSEKNPHGLLLQDWKFVLYENEYLSEKD